MSDILSQSEIEALLQSLGGESAGENASQEGEEGASPVVKQTSSRPVAALSYELYDFRRPDKFSKEQLRSLQMLHETFGRLGGTALSAFLRNTVHIDLISLEQVPYEEYLRSINQSVFVITSMPPLSGQAVLEIEFSLIFAMIDKLLGGPGRTIDRTVLTDLEEPLVRQLVERLFSSLKGAWEGIVIVNPGIEGLETSAQFVQIAPPTDIVVSLLFEVKVGEVRGAMSLCIPYMLLKPITSKLSSQKWFATGHRKSSPAAKQQLVGHVGNTEVECAIQLGTADITVRDLISLKCGDVVVLDQKKDKDLLLNVSGTPKFEGKPALDGKNVVFTVTGVHA
ncbi:MAG TPA: flagellar motor switch protein FliM [Fimbriimonadaceae bacterium]|nr:flagellar motor switch protein FliM [Fimbriimonadaceae bacterium]